jgi:SNF2-related domain/Helicase conserved C-terminal domain
MQAAETDAATGKRADSEPLGRARGEKRKPHGEHAGRGEGAGGSVARGPKRARAAVAAAVAPRSRLWQPAAHAWPCHEIQLSGVTNERKEEALGCRLVAGEAAGAAFVRLLDEHDVPCAPVEDDPDTGKGVTCVYFAAADYARVARLLAERRLDKSAQAPAIRALPPELVDLLDIGAAQPRELEEASAQVDANPAPAHIPPGLWATLKRYQRRAVHNWRRLNGRMYLADDPGLGKTLQAIACSLVYRDKWPVLVVCPSSVKANWSAEFCRWLNVRAPAPSAAAAAAPPARPDRAEGDAKAPAGGEGGGAPAAAEAGGARAEAEAGGRAPAAAATATFPPFSAANVKIFETEAEVLAWLPDPSAEQREAARRQVGLARSSVLFVGAAAKGSARPRKGKKAAAKRSLEEKAAAGRRAGTGLAKPARDVYVVSYDLLIRPGAFARIAARRFQMLISDESHFLRNGGSQRTVHFTSLAHQCPHVILLSGTPGHCPEQLYHPMCALQPTLFPAFWVTPPGNINTQERWRNVEPRFPCTYAGRWCDPRPETTFAGKFAWVLNGGCRLQELNSVLREFCLVRRTKDEVLRELPEKVRIPIQFDVPDHERQLIETEMTAMNAVRLSKPNEFKARFMRLWNDLPRVKTPAVREYLAALLNTGGELNPASGPRRKALLFAHHTAMISVIEESVRARKIGYIKITGLTPAPKRQVAVNAFQSDPEVQVAVLSMTAAGFGLNLQAASLVVFFELFFGPDVMIQAEDRSHRLGQTAPRVECRYLIARGTLDEKLLKMVQRKTSTSAMLTEGRKQSFEMARAQTLALATNAANAANADPDAGEARADPEPPADPADAFGHAEDREAAVLDDQTIERAALTRLDRALPLD